MSTTKDELPIPMANKTPEMRDAIESLFPGTKAAIAAKICPLCKQPIGEFKDALSVKEYGISGMCQKCQDSAFAEPEEDDGIEGNMPDDQAF